MKASIPNKTSRTQNGVVAAVAVIMATISGLAQASIMLTSYSENATSFSATYAFTPDISPDTELPPGSLWLASLSQSFLPTGLGMGTYEFDWTGQHPTLGLLASDSCQFSNSVLTGTVCNQTMTVADGTDSDTYNFMVNLVSGGGTATLTGLHNVAAVPIPGAVWLFASGLMGLMGVARRKARQADAI